MRFDSVIAHAFGPFEGQSMEFAPGMNIVHGPNESGKSTWHAAMYAGLCGMRRGQGARKEDKDFKRQYQPWDSDRWEVSAVITLEDGRQVELHHDLNGLVDCSAKDVTFPDRDYSGDIINEGTPDGSRWLGLNRRSFVSTACVRQTDLLGLTDPERADALQEQLQRAADTAGTDATAARALDLLKAHHVKHVGSDLAFTKPLRVSQDRALRAERELSVALVTHEELIGRLRRVDQLEQTFDHAASRSALVDAAIATSVANKAEHDLERARTLDRRFPSGAPTRQSADAELARQVAAAREAWRTRPPLPELSGPDAESLRDELAEIDAAESAQDASPDEPAEGKRPGIFGLIIRLGKALLALIFRRGRARPRPLDPGSLSNERQRRRSTLRDLIAAREHEEAAIADAQQRRSEAELLVEQAAERAGITGDSSAASARALERWETEREEAVTADEEARDEWRDLEHLLGGRTLEVFAKEVSDLRERSGRLATECDPSNLSALLEPPPTEADLRRAQRETNDARAELERARGEIESFATNAPSVTDAEDELAAAQSESAQVEDLGDTLSMTIEFLERAEERVHRDIAPVLQSTVAEWLPLVTGGRYTEVRVDPETLRVDVAGADGRWRDARLLSHGTAEQIYLLLRMAMTRHLTEAAEVCPLILDDVVTAFDADRKQQVLDTLLAISESTQVILFSHEKEVLDWAQDRLHENRNKLITLSRAGAI